ncbi:unnamed protein product [Zymoseptoria tritici ST99CH_3D1]|nr:unnamed protein product [Zymoseptoria tritici ST99CH_3D1]
MPLKPPSDLVDWQRLEFDSIEVNGHVQSIWTSETSCWSVPTFVQDPLLCIHGLSSGLNYGQQVFEGLKAFRHSNDDVHVFRPQAHAARFAQSASLAAIPPVPHELFMRAISMAIELNSEYVPPSSMRQAALYIRPLALASSPALNLRRATQFHFAVYVIPVAAAQKARLEGARALVVEDFDRAAPQGTGRAKIGGNYAPMTVVMERAREQQYDLTLHLDSATHTMIEEFSVSGFVGVRRDGSVTTLLVADGPTVLKSITADSLCQLASSFGWEVDRRQIPFDEVRGFHEAFAVGTAFVLTPIQSITRRSTSETIHFPGRYEDAESSYHRLCEAFKGIQTGERPDTWTWMEKVPIVV